MIHVKLKYFFMSLFYFLIITYTINVYNYVSIDRFNIFEAHAYVYLLAFFSYVKCFIAKIIRRLIESRKYFIVS